MHQFVVVLTDDVRSDASRTQGASHAPPACSPRSSSLYYRYAAALENHVPIVSADYVRALAGEAVEVEPGRQHDDRLRAAVREHGPDSPRPAAGTR